MRLLTDPVFGEEFDTVVDEITDQYIKNELRDDEREQVEKLFLNTTERQDKLQFATELLRRAAVERGPVTVTTDVEPSPSLLERFSTFWRAQAFARLAATVAALIIVAGLIFFLLRSGTPDTSNYVALNLAITTAERATGPAPTRVQRPATGLKLVLAVPEQARNATDYRVKLISTNGAEQDLTIEERNQQTVIAIVPPASLTRGSYVVQLSMVKADGAAERVRGSYYFDIE